MKGTFKIMYGILIYSIFMTTMNFWNEVDIKSNKHEANIY